MVTVNAMFLNTVVFKPNHKQFVGGFMKPKKWVDQAYTANHSFEASRYGEQHQQLIFVKNSLLAVALPIIGFNEISLVTGKSSVLSIKLKCKALTLLLPW